MILEKYIRLSNIAVEEFSHIVSDTNIISLPIGIPLKLRIFLINDTLIDIWLSKKGRYSYHWEHRPVRNYIYRHDNAPHKRWKKITTFPKHFHSGKYDDVEESFISDMPEKAIREFLGFVEEWLKKKRLKYEEL